MASGKGLGPERAKAAKRLIAACLAEPWLMAGTGFADTKLIEAGKGKVFTTVMGHADYSMQCIGFQTVVNRGAEWVATGKVTLPVPAKFPTADATLSADAAK